ncbi:MAG: hypothetical protein EZS28_043199 [Streblomastix strix]|uniref:Uncharacterized protein n=1 Tax=Streblomastix strix TaxID=222440 RepID=A0A5J4TV42_9EUKA|nr:MAG: hypothetical protein EZS28_043199 [Streblomastix strix]
MISQGKTNRFEHKKERRSTRQNIQWELNRKDLTRQSWMQKRKGNRAVVAETVNKHKKIGHGKEIQQSIEQMEIKIGQLDIVEMFFEIMKLVIDEEKKKPRIMLSEQNKELANKDDLTFFIPPMNYIPTSISRLKDQNLSKELWNLFDGSVREGVIPFHL